jgi:hypothetical protein
MKRKTKEKRYKSVKKTNSLFSLTNPLNLLISLFIIKNKEKVSVCIYNYIISAPPSTYTIDPDA